MPMDASPRPIFKTGIGLVASFFSGVRELLGISRSFNLFLLSNCTIWRTSELPFVSLCSTELCDKNCLLLMSVLSMDAARHADSITFGYIYSTTKTCILRCATSYSIVSNFLQQGMNSV